MAGDGPTGQTHRDNVLTQRALNQMARELLARSHRLIGPSSFKTQRIRPTRTDGSMITGAVQRVGRIDSERDDQ